MFILTKRTAPSEATGRIMHDPRGHTEDVGRARAWFLGSITTDVIEIVSKPTPRGVWDESDMYTEIIRDEHIPSWREQQFQNEKAAAGLKLPRPVDEKV
jgi:hypothetical protein